jgi:aerobic-type carbon monoxide dehydrogenase small subunit (CoxS/CutS family)
MRYDAASRMTSGEAISLHVNGREVTVAAADGERPLLEVLREDLALTGTKYSCGEGACGACSVLADGKRIFSCSTPVAKLAGKSITTIEALADKPDNGADGADKHLHPVQRAFIECNAFQCGYCTPGMIMATVALLSNKPKPTDDEISDGMNGNVCRCCGYANIHAAVKRAAEQVAKK